MERRYMMTWFHRAKNVTDIATFDGICCKLRQCSRHGSPPHSPYKTPCRLKLRMWPITQRFIVTVFAAAKINRFVFWGIIFYWRKACFFMRAIAHWLSFAEPAGEPVIALSRFDLNWVWGFLWDMRFHWLLLINCRLWRNQKIKASLACMVEKYAE